MRPFFNLFCAECRVVHSTFKKFLLNSQIIFNHIPNQRRSYDNVPKISALTYRMPKTHKRMHTTSTPFIDSLLFTKEVIISHEKSKKGGRDQDML